MKKKLCLLLSIVMLAGITCTAGYTPVAASENFISGYEDGTFRPDGRLTRAEAASMMSQLIKGDAKKEIAFSDVKADDWYHGALAELNAKNMLNSYGKSFEGGKNITRIEFAEFVYIYKNGYKENATRFDMFSNLIANGLISGYEDGTYRESGELTRAEAVALVNRMLGTVVDKEAAKDSFADVAKEHWAYADIYAATSGKKDDAPVVAVVKDPVWGDKIEYQPGVTYPIAPPADQATKVMDKYNEKGSTWKTVGMINETTRAAGVTIGSDGCQRMSAMAISQDGQLLFAGHDTMSVHRSTDGGKTWHKGCSGLYPGTLMSIEIDPNNKNNVLAFATAGSSGGFDIGGLYLTNDGGDNWYQVLSQKYGGAQVNYLNPQIAWDPSSYDAEKGTSMVAYWSKPYELKARGSKPDYDPNAPENANEKEGLWKTTDGGKTWELVNPDMKDSLVRVHPTNGTVYASNLDGFFRSEDGGVTFKRVLGGSMIYGLDVILTQPDYVYINDYKGVIVSKDCGKTFERIEATSFPVAKSTTNPIQSVVQLKVSPANPLNMAVGYYSGFGAYDSRVYYSNDGGVSWAQSAENYDGYFFKNNDRETNLMWDPTDGNELWANVGDYVSCSTDAGATLKYSSDGLCDVFVDGRTIFNMYDPDIFFYGSQDFVGAYTKDNGENWYVPYKIYSQSMPSSGFLYGTYATADGHMFAGVIRSGGWGNPIKLMVSHDWGETWEDTDIVPYAQGDKKNEMIYQSPTDENVIFVGGADCGYRTKDKGYTWEKMEVNTVMCHNPYGRKEIYASKGRDEIYVSYNNGDTWEFFAKAEYTLQEGDAELGYTSPAIWDMAYDGVNDILYYIGGISPTGRHFAKIQNGVQTDLTDGVKAAMEPAHNEYTRGPSFQLCTVDPRYPQVLYVGGYSNVLKNPAGVVRSVDYGETWQIISNTNREHSIVKEGQTGGIEPADLIVHPLTGELWIPQVNSGWSKIAPPYEN